MVKDHSDSERENPLLPHGLLFPINSKGSFICTICGVGKKKKEKEEEGVALSCPIK